MPNNNPVYVFVGGVSHTPAFFEQQIKEMSALGFDSTAVAYPTCGDGTEDVKQWDEVTAIQEATTAHLDAGRDVVLVLHSYGGWPGSRAVKSLDKEARTKAGKATGIIEVVFLAAFLLPDNAPMANYSYLPPWLTVKDGCRIPNETSMPLLFSDMDEAAQIHWLGKFAWHRNDFTAETVPDAPWTLSVPKTYIVTTGDKTATVEFQFQMLQAVIDDTWTIKSIRSGHEPFLSQPAALAKVLVQPTV
ncbi:Alpha/Beta hydrolase protein [Xylaria arbuscula]|nr:Alpha/Beta hydrolase protein [Xylaria arbuscula]